jgi:hypothetical protein
MTRGEFRAAWVGVDAADRLAAIVAWVTGQIPRYPEWVQPTFSLTTGGASGDCATGYVLPQAVFEDPSPNDADALGHTIIQQCAQLGQIRYYENLIAAQKKVNDNVEEWLAKMLDDLLKDYADALKEMAKFFLVRDREGILTGR